MNGLEMLKADHRKVSELFGQFEAASDAKKQSLFEQIKTELETHTQIEETIFYPALEEEEELKDMVLEAYEEHKQVKTLLREISALSENSEKFEAKMKVMKENVEHHVEEEEQELFPKVEQFFDQQQLDTWGKEFAAAKGQIGKKHQTKSGSK